MIDWAQTRAFSYGTFGNVIVNVRGRESEGTVEPGEEYERVRDEIAARAMELRDPEGAPIVAAVHRREDLFEGPELDKVPDLLIEFAEYAWLGKGNVKKRADSLWDTIEVEPGSEHVYVGSHRHEGLFVLAGPSAAQAPRTLAEIQDIAPTVALPARRAAADTARGPDPRRGARPGAPRLAPAGLRRPRARARRRRPAEQLQRGRGGRGRRAAARARLPRMTDVKRVARAAWWLARLLLALYVFVGALQLMKTGAASLSILQGDGFLVENAGSTLGLGWLGALLVLSGSPIAATALTLVAGGEEAAAGTHPSRSCRDSRC